MASALVILAILAAPFIPGLLVVTWVMADELLRGGHGR